MFSKNKSTAGSTVSAVSSKQQDQTTLISSGTTITGDTAFSGTMHVEGIIKGNVSADEGLLTVAHSGKVEGDIQAPKIIIDGQVRGNVYAEEHLELASRAAITGNVFYSVIEMEKGSQVNGSLEYHPNGMPDVRPLLEKARDLSQEGEVIEG
ncbi:hypothetical protein ACH42_11640 [Endozoicomonas sp. (ex Bugula neritina AB1)]|nr:hypothetical protein ACH42_11640 [Endozoicomonas sp. (ex Bugula neritina AB1)]